MSKKLKDALELLLSENPPVTATDKVEPARDDGDDLHVPFGDEAEIKNADLNGQRHGDEGRVDSDIDVMPTGYRPNQQVQIEKQPLINHGLRPQGTNLESIDRQFGRIKRPIINNAFSYRAGSVENANVIMVVSPLAGSGKSMCSFNLAARIARERDYGVLLVDADVVRQNLSKGMGLDRRVGLMDYLVDSTVHLNDILISTDLDDIFVIPAGKRNDEATELIASKRMHELVSALTKLYPNRAIIFDTPPLLATSEAHVLIGHAGQIVFIIEAGVATHDSVLQALALLDRDKPINAILNKSPDLYSSDRYFTRYDYYPVTGADEND